MNFMPQRFWGVARAPLAAPADHPLVNYGRIGVLLVNLGTPDGTSYWPMRRYLKEFLSDRRVIEANSVVWWLILNMVVLTKRPFTSGEAYRSVWNSERDESPLRTITRSQSDKIGALLARDPRIEVDWAMRYGNPSIKSRLEALQEKGCDRILIFPLYPQYSAATSATACDKTFDALKEMRWQPAIRVVPPYFEDPDYIDALAASTKARIAALDFEPEVVISSFHGLPRSYTDAGDPYYCHCAKTVRLLRDALGWSENRLLLTFQSRFGSAEWLQPYTADTIADLAQRGVKRVAVMTPGFSSDCIETLEEMGIQGAEIFLENGGEKFAALPCLNDSSESIDTLTTIVKRELSGWVHF
ncbi:ferrochelatase [Rhodomicrobium vannielii ATCC 17100]|uniref:ferrochelatase n=1 Tax=Rhodomicrobium vannielii TaxID=1069 RepID=UPI001919E410|nr:ferrochelatase [Rhodomicrobium vannielii]MBJ7534563.1 ferrochelatase [Rhodomicrobium vannielii ATCC 17100]